MNNNHQTIAPFRALLYKERQKTRFTIFGIAAIWGIALLANGMRVYRIVRTHGAPAVWDAVLYKDFNLLAPLQWLPLAVGLALGLAQFLPEVRQKRLKLTLHLPLRDGQLLGTMLVYGYLLQLVAACIVLPCAYLVLIRLFPHEMVNASLLTSLPWFITGASAYGLVGWICIEPVIRRRVTYAVLAALCLYVGFLSNNTCAYSPFAWTMLLFAFVIVPTLCFGALARFREGETANATPSATPRMAVPKRTKRLGDYAKSAAYGLLLLIGAAASSVFLPHIFHLTLDRSFDLPFTVYSGVTRTFAVFEGGVEDGRYRDDAGNTYTRREFDSILPTLYYTQLIRDGRFPDSLFGVPVTADFMSENFFVFHSRPVELNRHRVPLYPLVNADSERVTIAESREAFRWKEDGIEIIRMEDNSIDVAKTELFQTALQGIALPVKITVCNPESRKEYDNGYLIVDANDSLWQLKQQDNRPVARRLHAPQGDGIQMAWVTEFDNHRSLGYVSSESGRFYSVDALSGQCMELPLGGFSPRRESLMVFGNFFDQTIRIIDEPSVRYIAINSAAPLQQLRLYSLELPSDWVDRVAQWLFPFELTLTSRNSVYIYPRMQAHWSWQGLPLCFLLACLTAGLTRRESVVSRILKACGVLLFGIYLALPLLLWRR